MGWISSRQRCLKASRVRRELMEFVRLNGVFGINSFEMASLEVFKEPL